MFIFSLPLPEGMFISLLEEELLLELLGLLKFSKYPLIFFLSGEVVLLDDGLFNISYPDHLSLSIFQIPVLGVDILVKFLIMFSLLKRLIPL
jgi:hypothetical protein